MCVCVFGGGGGGAAGAGGAARGEPGGAAPPCEPFSGVSFYAQRTSPPHLRPTWLSPTSHWIARRMLLPVGKKSGWFWSSVSTITFSGAKLWCGGRAKGCVSLCVVCGGGGWVGGGMGVGGWGAGGREERALGRHDLLTHRC